jgi:hypothetical protein
MTIDICNPAHCYLLGYFWADAYFGQNLKGRWTFSFEIKESDFVIIWEDIKSMGFVKYRNRKRKHSSITQSSIQASKQEDMKFFEFHEFHNKEKGCPLYFILSPKMRKFFIKGFLDGDGSISLDKNNLFRVSFNGPYEQNWDFLEDFCHSHHIVYKIYRKERTSKHNTHKKKIHKCSVLEFTNIKNKLKFCSTLSDVNIGIRRKFEIYDRYKEWYDTKPVSSTKEIISTGISLKNNGKYYTYSIASIHGIYKYIGNFKTFEEALSAQQRFKYFM